MRRPAIVILVGGLIAAVGSARAADGGWAARVDPEGQCQISVPGGWKEGTLGASSAISPDGKAYAVVASEGLPFAMFKQAVVPSLQPTKVLKSTDSYYAAELASKYGDIHTKGLYVAMARGADGLCRAEVHYAPAHAETARKIGESLRPK